MRDHDNGDSEKHGEVAEEPSSSDGDDELAELLEAGLAGATSSSSGSESEGEELAAETLQEREDEEPVPEEERPEQPEVLSLKRKREDVNTVADMQPDEPGASPATKEECPPHPGFMWGVCIRCGRNKPEDEPAEERAVALRYIHEGLELSAQEAGRLKNTELQRVLREKKLLLVLDLDHTLLNSARFSEVTSEDIAYLLAAYGADVLGPPAKFAAYRKAHPGIGGPPPGILGGSEQDGQQEGFVGTGPREGAQLHQLPFLQMWTKLRPFAREFLDAASELFELYVYTMGERIYANAMARLLDPSGEYFADRIISSGDSTLRHAKDLDVVLGAESAVLIIDDTEMVWPKHRANLLVVERYHFFRSSRRQFLLPGASLVEKRQDEHPRQGTLASILQVLKRTHAAFFRDPTQPPDVREVLKRMQQETLQGVRVTFSRVFPQSLAHPERHPLWRQAEALGAQCARAPDEDTTHVVAGDSGTDKARWAKRKGKHVVRPDWLDCCQLLWKRAPEEDYPVPHGSPPDAVTVAQHSKTVEKPLPEEVGDGVKGDKAGSDRVVESEPGHDRHDVEAEGTEGVAELSMSIGSDPAGQADQCKVTGAEES